MEKVQLDELEEDPELVLCTFSILKKHQISVLGLLLSGQIE